MKINNFSSTMSHLPPGSGATKWWFPPRQVTRSTGNGTAWPAAFGLPATGLAWSSSSHHNRNQGQQGPSTGSLA